jgi:hypothetical protein
MAYVILARSGSSTYFFTEAVAGVVMMGGSFLGMHWFGLAGVGGGFLATYIVYYLTVWVIVRRDIHLVWTTQNSSMMLAGLGAALVIRVLPFVGLESWRTPVGLLLAILAGLGAAYIIWGDMGGMQNARVPR